MNVEIIMKNLKNKQFKVVRISEDISEFELDNGDVYPIPFELDYKPSVEEFQKMLDNSKDLMIEMLKKING